MSLNLSYNPVTSQSDQNWRLFVPCNLEIWCMTLKNSRAPLLYYVKLCALFQSNRWIQTGVIVWKCSIWVKIGDFLSHVTLKFDVWPWKAIGLFYATSSFMFHFKTISIQTGFTVWKHKIQVKNSKFVVPYDLNISHKNNPPRPLCFRNQRYCGQQQPQSGTL